MPEDTPNRAFNGTDLIDRSTPASMADRDIDFSLLEDSLRLTPWQRLVENDRALGLVRMLEKAGTRTHGATDPDSRTAEP